MPAADAGAVQRAKGLAGFLWRWAFVHAKPPECGIPKRYEACIEIEDCMLDSQRLTKFLQTVPVIYNHFQVTGRYRFQESIIEVKV